MKNKEKSSKVKPANKVNPSEPLNQSELLFMMMAELKVTKWVEHKIEKIITKDLEQKIVEENSIFDVETYVNNLWDKYFNDNDIKNLKQILNLEAYDFLYVDSENSTEGRNTYDSLEFEANELRSLSLEEIIKNLVSDSVDIRKKSLKVLEIFAEDLMGQASWNKVKEILQKMLSRTVDRETINLILKVYQKPLMCLKKPQIISKGFTTIVEVVVHQIDLLNLEHNNTSFEQMYDIKEDEWFCEEESAECGFTVPKNLTFVNPEVLIKLMWVLIDCQQQIQAKRVRFNEARFREIIFSFIHLLSSTSSSENEKLSGLELLSVLNPRASWCRYWCHTAAGRSLLCSALRKYKQFFIHVVEIILNHMKVKKLNKLPPVRDDRGFTKISPQLADDVSGDSKPFKKNVSLNKQRDRKTYLGKAKLNDIRKRIGFLPDENGESSMSKNVRIKKKTSSEWIVENIPKHIVTEAVFLHSISLVSCLIQFRSGRALFPVQTSTRRRLLSAQDLSLSVIEYLENIDFVEWRSSGITYTSAYETEVLEMIKILKKVKTHINSSRMSAGRQQFSYV